MVIYTSGTQLELVTSSVAPILASVSYVDITATTNTPGAYEVSLSGVATTGILLASPATGVTRIVKEISLHNEGAALNTIELQKNVATTIYQLTPDYPMGIDTSVNYQDGVGWQFINASGMPVINQLLPNDVVSQTVSGSYTWTKPTHFTPHLVEVIMYGAGGGGGQGSAEVGTGNGHAGGAGGGGGAYNHRVFLASDLGATETFSVGGGGTGGALKTSGWPGTAGSQGGPTLFGTTTLMAAYGGGGGKGGNDAANNSAPGGGGGGGIGSAGTNGAGNAAGVGGLPGLAAGVQTPNGGQGSNGSVTASITTCYAEWGGGGGGGNTASPGAGSQGGSSLYGGGGGGCGAAFNGSYALTANPQVGGRCASITVGGGGAVGPSLTVRTAASGVYNTGISGLNGFSGRGGFGGGGGGALTGTSTFQSGIRAGDGGAGGSHGGGGGGGGPRRTAVAAGGWGGKGGDGAIYIITY